MSIGPGAFERILFQELLLHPFRVPHTGIRPLDCQVSREGRPFGRFGLKDLLNGQFDNVPIVGPNEVADIDRTVSNQVDLEGSAGLSGLLGPLAKAGAKVKAGGARHATIKSLEAVIVEADAGPLLTALQASTIQTAGAIGAEGTAVLLTAVVSAKSLSIILGSELGARVSASADLADAVAFEAGAKAEIAADGSLKMTYDTPMPFAARCWLIKRSLWSAHPRVVGPSGPLTLMGEDPSGGFDEEYLENISLSGGSLVWG